jgi:beta-1,4-mannosyltransferase
VLRAIRDRVDLWHLHFPDAVVHTRSTLRSAAALAFFCMLLQLARWRGTKIVWTVHDLGSLDRLHPRLEGILWRFFVPRVDAWVCLSQAGLALARERFPGLCRAPVLVCPRGSYADAYSGVVQREKARRALGLSLEATLLLQFGRLRPYKNVPHLIRTFEKTDDQNVQLLIAGLPFDGELEREVRASVGDSGRVYLLLGHIQAKDVPLLFGAADLIVLPYRRIFNSGVLHLAMTFARPVLAPALGILREQQAFYGCSWIRLFEGELTKNELDAAVAWARSTPRPASPPAPAHDWKENATELVQLYQRAARLWSIPVR